jgi:purine-binding chemotaxis protein CheW
MKNDPTKPHESQEINWSEIQSKMEASRQALEKDSGFSPEASLAILKNRARILAREPQQVDTAQEFLEIVKFSLATETYGVESAFVREIYPLKEFTHLPGVPPFVFGITNVRGQILSIIDLKKFFNLPQKGLGQLNKLIILHDGKMEFGILADDILGAHSISLDSIQSSPPTISGIGAEYLRGVTNENLIILDAKKILYDKMIIVDQASY